MSIDETAQEMARELLRRNPAATVGEVASYLSACACVGCPTATAPDFHCECGRKCRCACRLEPYASRNRERQDWALSQARIAVSATAGDPK